MFPDINPSVLIVISVVNMGLPTNLSLGTPFSPWGFPSMAVALDRWMVDWENPYLEMDDD